MSGFFGPVHEDDYACCGRHMLSFVKPEGCPKCWHEQVQQEAEFERRQRAEESEGE